MAATQTAGTGTSESGTAAGTEYLGEMDGRAPKKSYVPRRVQSGSPILGAAVCSLPLYPPHQSSAVVEAQPP